MHNSSNRRTATKVKAGRVQRKNRHLPTAVRGYVLDRRSPSRGYRHVVSKRDVQAFIDIIPDFANYSRNLDRIVLGANNYDYDGLHVFYFRDETCVIYLNAWMEDLWFEVCAGYFDAHEAIFTRIGLSHDRRGDMVACRFTEAQARAFMLLHVFMHELGHHHDSLHLKHHSASRGEDYADRFAEAQFEQLYPAYVRVFGDPKLGG